jgi:hypothetical protein
MSAPARALPLLMLTGVVIFLAGLAKHRAYVSGDAWWYTAVGRDLLEQGLTLVDRFSYASPERPYLNKFIAASVVWAWVVESLGERALYLLAAASGVLVLAWTVLQTRVQWPSRLAAAPFVIVLLAVDGQLFEARAQNPGHLLFLAALALLHRAQRPRLSLVLAWGALAVVWTNWHPSFLLAIALPVVVACLWLLLEAPEERPSVKGLFALAGVALVATGASPYGFDLLRSTLRLVIDPTTNAIEHMRGPPPTLAWASFALATLAVVALRAASSRAAQRSSDVALVLLFLAMTWVSQRYAALCMIVTIRVLLPTVDEAWRERGHLSPREHYAAAALALCAAVVGGFLFTLPREDPLWGPREAAAWVDENQPTGRVFNEYAHGGYLMYAWGPHRRVFIDGRNDLFDNEVFEDYERIMHISLAGLKLLDVYGVNTVIAASMSPLDATLGFLKEWDLAFEGDGVVYVRREPVDSRIIRPAP